MRVIVAVFFMVLLHGATAQDTTHVQLKEVTVSGKKQLFEQKTDRMIINVRNSITSAGGTALDVLEKAPGVSVDRQGNRIAINGKSGVSIMINGKMTYMPADALTQFLAGVSAGNIEKIELMTTPPARYDAGGNAGYINIVLVDNPYAGISGSYFLTAGYGFRESAAAGANFNYRDARVNLYGNYSFNYDHYIQESSGFVQYGRTGSIVANNLFSYRDANRPVNNIRIGMDYQLDTANVVGVLVSGYTSRWSMVARNGATVSRNDLPDTIISSVDDPEINLWQNIMVNFNFQHTYKPGKVLSLDVSHIYYKDNNPNTYHTDYFTGKGAFLYHEDLRSGKTTPIHFQVYSSAYTTALGKRVKMDLGAKLTFSNFTNNVYSDHLRQGNWVADTGLTAVYSLKENIGAAYTSFMIDPGNKISITAGLRYEYTDSRLGSTKARDVNRRYGELFPSFTFSKRFDVDNSISFSYGRRITRPAFSDLAPFTVFFDPKTFYSGNPALQPAIANALQVGYGYKRYSFTVSYTHEVNTISNFYFQTQRLDTVGNMLYFSARNFKYERYVTVSLSMPFRVAAWWDMQYNIDCHLKQISTVFDNEPVRLQNFGVNLVSVQRFVLPGSISLELSGSYASMDFAGTAKRRPFFLLDAGVQKKLGDNKHILRLAINDVFNSGGSYRFGETLPSGAVLQRRFDFNLRGGKLTYTYNFGNQILKGKRDRATGAEDELKRVVN